MVQERVMERERERGRGRGRGKEGDRGDTDCAGSFCIHSSVWRLEGGPHRC